jgi:tetratricopeptide (TPR) repeat protein
MAAAELSCIRCGAPAPPGRSALLLLGRAERAFESESLEEAVALLGKALQSGLPQEQLLTAWRKYGVWQEKLAAAGHPEMLPRAGEAFKQALALNDSDELLHQLYIANMGRQGKLMEAKAYYQDRLAKNPDDALAQRQLTVIKLSAEFLLSPPKVSFAMPPRTIIERWLEPKPWKVLSVGSTLALSIVMVAVCLMHGGSSGTSVASPDGIQSLVGSTGLPFNVTDILLDPWSWAMQGAFSALALFMMYRNR